MNDDGTLIYLDNAATTRAAPEVAAEVARCLTDAYGNPSSLHPKGIEAEEILAKAAASVSGVLGASRGQVVFTSGGTEANNLALLGAALARRRSGARLVSTRIEHPSVINTLRELESLGFEVALARVNREGVIDLDDVARLLTPSTILISVMHVNNETGAIQPLREVSDILRASRAQALFHVDAVQSVGHVRFSPEEIGADMATISAHKIHGPKGVGALWVRDGVRLKPIIHGGGQQRSLRSGTENVPGIAGFGAACSMIASDPGFAERELRPIRNALAERILDEIPGSVLLGPRNAAPHILNVAFRDVKGEVLLRMLGACGVCVSTGAACSSRKGHGSHVLEAMGVDPDLAAGSVRLSLGRFNSMDEVETIVERMKACVERVRGFRG